MFPKTVLNSFLDKYKKKVRKRRLEFFAILKSFVLTRSSPLWNWCLAYIMFLYFFFSVEICSWWVNNTKLWVQQKVWVFSFLRNRIFRHFVSLTVVRTFISVFCHLHWDTERISMTLSMNLAGILFWWKIYQILITQPECIIKSFIFKISKICIII